MPREDPIREYFEIDLPDKRFREQNERLQRKIDEGIGMRGSPPRLRKTWWISTPGMDSKRAFGLSDAIEALDSPDMISDMGHIPLVRWSGCLWHLMVSSHCNPARVVSACGETFPMGERVEGKLEIEPNRNLTCMGCWTHVEAAKVALILAGESDE